VADDTPPATGSVGHVPCPFAKRPLSLSGSIPKTGLKVSAELGCDHVKVGVGGGPFEFSAKRTFVTHRMDYHFDASVEGDIHKDGVATVKAGLGGSVDVAVQGDGTTTMTTTVRAEASAKVWNVASVELRASVSSDHMQ
jgi:hypothetical protein